MNRTHFGRALLGLSMLAAALPGQLVAQASERSNLLSIDASGAAPAPQPVAAALGTARNPKGETIGVNSQYLTLNGHPWLPVMGEFHFSRYPKTLWEQEILKMKAAGVQIVSTYIIWIHHEQAQGQFDWTGQRDLRRFTQLCARHGMYVYPRIGPWAHAEVRNGGLPDWVLKSGPVRQNDPIYLKEVQAFYAQIGEQLKGLLWKDGGPVIGLQVENEYRQRGAGRGEEHIRTLKRMAIDAGMDVPLYTVTGWDGAAIPLDAALPVFGGYPDAPWDGSPHKLPPNEVYAFRFDNRSAGSMGAIGGRNQSAASTYAGTPFLTAEVGDGIEDTYFRRPVVSADDVAAIVPVILGSGANLLGYYMFHGGRNPEGGEITLQESQITGYPTDVPTRSYDFQAPLGEFGQVRDSLRKLKLVHYFLADFGAQLAPMQVHAPSRVPSDPADRSVARVSARTLDNAGFIFVSNFVRGLDMPDRPAFQVDLKLPAGSVHIPEQPILLPANSYGIWPVNLPLAGAEHEAATLRYSTAQLFKRVQSGDQTFYFFFALPRIPAEFAFASGTAVTPSDASVKKLEGPGLTRWQVSGTKTSELRLPGGIHLVIMPQAEAEKVWRVDDPSVLVLTAADFFSDGDAWTLRSDNRNQFSFELFGSATPPGTRPGSPHAALQQASAHQALFAAYTASVPAVQLKPVLSPVHPADPPAAPKFGPPLSWRKTPVPLAPDDADFDHAAVWKIAVPPLPAGAALAGGTLSDVFLSIDYQGDVARLYQDGKVVDDNFWNGLPWTVGLRETVPGWPTTPTEYLLRVTPLSKSYGMYLEQSSRLHFDASGVAAALTGVSIIPQYQLELTAPTGPSR